MLRSIFVTMLAFGASSLSYAAEQKPDCFETLSQSKRSAEIYFGRPYGSGMYIQAPRTKFGLASDAILLLNYAALVEVTRLCNGNFVAVWRPDYNGKVPEPFKGKILDAQHRELIEGFLLAEKDAIASSYSVAGLMNGNFVVVWQQLTKSSTRLRMTVFDPTGKAVTKPFELSADGSRQYGPTVQGLPDGGFVLHWISQAGAMLRVFEANLKPRTQPILIAPGNLEWKSYSHVTRDGTINVFLRRSTDPAVDFYTGPNTRAIQLARSLDSKGNPLSEVLESPSEIQNLVGYQSVLEYLAEATAYRLENLLRALEKRDALSAPPRCNFNFFGLDQAISRKKITKEQRMKDYFKSYCMQMRSLCSERFEQSGALEGQYAECIKND